MKILIEGPDQVGKSLLSKVLAESLDLPAYHMSAPPEGGQYSLADYTTYFSGPGVYDRAHLGSIVYGQFLGYHKNILRPFIREALERWLLYTDSVLFIITCDAEVLQQRIIQNNREEMCNVGEILVANHFYQLLAKETLFAQTAQFLHIHCTNDSPFPSLQDVEEVLRYTFPGVKLQKEDGEGSSDEREPVDTIRSE